jgi:hypothetical protein
MEKNDYLTDVIFRKFKDDKNIIALFPYDIWDNKLNCTSYMHLGQHGAADYPGVIMVSVPAKEAEYSDLKKELECLGYDLKVIYKRSNKKLTKKLYEEKFKNAIDQSLAIEIVEEQMLPETMDFDEFLKKYQKKHFKKYNCFLSV